MDNSICNGEWVTYKYIYLVKGALELEKNLSNDDIAYQLLFIFASNSNEFAIVFSPEITLKVARKVGSTIACCIIEIAYSFLEALNFD